jgi:catechol 2,3-dioxygenase-like lactoylglutathione lyase family enzyme
LARKIAAITLIVWKKEVRFDANYLKQAAWAPLAESPFHPREPFLAVAVSPPTQSQQFLRRVHYRRKWWVPTPAISAYSSMENVMKIVPVIRSSDLQRSFHFYTEVLDFERKWPAGHEDREMANGVIDLVRDGAELQLSRHSGDGVFGSVNRVFVDDVDERYMTFRRRGLNTTHRPESPIHTAPVDQTWGLREFAVTDPDGNNLCFCTPKR